MLRPVCFLAILLFSCVIANAQTTVTGTLVGQDGKPMLVENVILTRPMENSVIKMVDPGKKGRYTITIDSAGIWILRYAGVNHYSHDVALYIGTPVTVNVDAQFNGNDLKDTVTAYVDKPATLKIDVQLKGYGYVDTLKDVKIIGDFNNFSFASAVPMQKQADGTYTAEFETKADSFAYQIVGVEKTGHSINGTDAERYVYDGTGDYKSVVTPKDGRVKIVFDPSNLVRWNKEATATFGDPNSVAAKFAEIYYEMQQHQWSFMDAVNEYRKSGKDMRQFKYDWSKVSAGLQQQIKDERNDLLHQELLLSYLELGSYGARLDSNLALTAVKDISPASLIWSLNPYVIPAALYGAGMKGADYDNYLTQVVDRNPSARTRAIVLFQEFMKAKYMNQSEKATKYYNILVNQYGDTQEGKMVKERFSAVSKLQVGGYVPAFSVVSMDDSTKTISSVSMKGKYYLMDFWATWCGPCVGEMGNLQKAYEKFKDKNFEILSLSLDQSPADVVKFRKDKWPMPWLHTFVGTNWDSKILKEFEVIGIPRPILVDPTGKVIAMEADLRGDNLDKTLEKYLGK
ncbi:MAG: redoxin domain-containing protein [Bacteroidetes bacterium]|nr:redoxin domain-containing protein [Bacteroidota bacterium]MCL5737421.1 redoxin domain-containing protein [Bacteroidota bacterium]